MPAGLTARTPSFRAGLTEVARAALPFTILATLAFELALAERKYALFGGGFGQSQSLDTPVEILVFLATLSLVHALLFFLLYILLRLAHGTRARTLLLPFNFVMLVGGGWIGFTLARYQALSYFSDAMSFEIVRNLGGGSLADALLYSLSEAGLILIGMAGFGTAYGATFLFLRPRLRQPAPALVLPSWRPATVAASLVLVALALHGANRLTDVRPALARFASVAALSLPLHLATDVDGDGWSLFSHPIDQSPFDPWRFPYALDIPGNGIDEDGLGGDLRLAASDPPAPTAPPLLPPKRKHVVLVVLESTRGDVLGQRVDGRPVAPILEHLALEGSVARAAYSHVGFTTYSLKSLFTGSLAPGPDGPSLVRDFLANGYRVGIFSGQSEDFGGIAEATGMRLGEIFVDANSLRDERSFSFAAEGSLNIDGKLLLREFDRRLGRRDSWTRPNFLYFNFQSAHFPYAFPGMAKILEPDPIPRGRIGPGERRWVARTYWNAVAYNDRLIGALIDRLRRLGVLDETIIIVTADHGESLFDDDFLGHGHALNAEQTRIPFIVSQPGLALPAEIGLTDMRGLILRAAGATLDVSRRPGVFQYLGELDRPAMIGLVEQGKWKLFDLFREAYRFEDAWIPYGRLTPARKKEADRLINLWASERWRARAPSSG